MFQTSRHRNIHQAEDSEEKAGQNISHLTQCTSTQHSMGMLGIPDAT